MTKKTINCVGGTLAVVLVTALAGGQWVLKTRLTPRVNKALERLSSTTGFEIRTQDASASLFAGRVIFTGVSARRAGASGTPPSLSFDRISATAGWINLLRDVRHVESLSIENARITIRRQPDETLRLPIADGAAARTPPVAIPPTGGTRTVATPSPPVAPDPMPKIAIKSASLTGKLIYEDATGGDPQTAPLSLDLSITATDLRTYGKRPPAEWGWMRMQTTRPTHPGTFAADVTFRLSPFGDPDSASLTAEGQLLQVRPRELGNLTDALGITGDAADIDLNLDIVNGVFQQDSTLRVVLHNAELAGDLRERYHRITLPAVITLILPVRGTLAEPTINTRQAITHSLLKNLADQPEAMLDQITIDGESIRGRLRRPRRD